MIWLSIIKDAKLIFPTRQVFFAEGATEHLPGIPKGRNEQEKNVPQNLERNSDRAKAKGTDMVASKGADLNKLAMNEAMDGDVKNFSDANFSERVLRAKGLVMVVFTAPSYCKPCQQLEPAIRQMAAEFRDRAKIGTYDIEAKDRNQEDINVNVKNSYAVSSLPTVLFFKDGNPVARFDNSPSPSVLRTFLSQRSGKPL